MRNSNASRLKQTAVCLDLSVFHAFGELRYSKSTVSMAVLYILFIREANKRL